MQVTAGITQKKITKSQIARKLGVSRQSLYYQKKLPLIDEEVKLQIESVLAEHKPYGHKRIAPELRLNKKRILRVMKKFNIKPYRRSVKKPFKKESRVVMVVTPQDALEAAAAVARKAGYRPLILGNAIEGETRDVALVHAGIARQAALYSQSAEPPCVLLSGGETTVTVRGQGRRRPQRRVRAGARRRPRRRSPHLGDRV